MGYASNLGNWIWYSNTTTNLQAVIVVLVPQQVYDQPPIDFCIVVNISNTLCHRVLLFC